MKRLLFFFLLSSCLSEPFVAADILQPGIEYCGQACDKLNQLGCEPSKDDCNVRCYEEHKEGYFWNTFCLTSITSCDMITTQCKSNYKKE